jgi:hypothetical protein
MACYINFLEIVFGNRKEGDSCGRQKLTLQSIEGGGGRHFGILGSPAYINTRILIGASNHSPASQTCIDFRRLRVIRASDSGPSTLQ